MKDYYRSVRTKYKKRPAEYWNLMASKYSDLEAVVVPGDLKLKNEYFDFLHRHAVEKAARFFTKGRSVLDVGCGIGRWSIYLAERGMKVTGVDISKEMIDLANQNAKKFSKRTKFFVKPIEKLNYKNMFDLVISVTVLQHIIGDKKRKIAVKKLVEATKLKGRIIILEKAVSKKTKEFHVKPLSKKGWIKLFKNNGARFVEEHGVDISPFLDFVTNLGMAFRYRKKRPKTYPGSKSIEETSSFVARKIYETLIYFAILVSKPIDYLLADNLLFKRFSKHRLMVFEKF